MAQTGIIRRLDDLGRIVIPKSIRSVMNIHEGSALEISVEDRQIIMTEYKSTNISDKVNDLAHTFYDNTDELTPEKATKMNQLIHEMKMLLNN